MSMLYDANQRIEKLEKRCRIYCEKRRQAGIKCSDQCENEETPILIWQQLFSSEFL